MVETLGFEIFADDKASAASAKISTTVKRLANDLELAQIKVAKATATVATVTQKHGAESVRAREAVARLARAELDAEGASNKLGAAHRRVGTSTEQATATTGRFRAALSSAGSTMAGVFGATVVSAGLSKFSEFAHSSIEAASSLGESMNAVQKVFGSSAKVITDWGANSAASYNLSQRAFQELATPLGAGLKNAGLSMQDTTKWTIELTKRAADMSSVFNVDVPDAMEAIQAGLRGEAEPLERFGVGLSAAATQAQAMADTHKTVASQLTTTELATARLNLIMKQTASTEGDATATADQFAGAQRHAAAEMENAKAKLGAGLLPIMAKITTVTATVVSGFASLPGPVQAVTVTVLALGAGVGFLLPRIVAAKEALTSLGAGSLAARAGVASVLDGVTKATAALAAMQLAGQAFSADSGAKGIETTKAALADLVATGSDSSGTLKSLDFDLTNIGISGRSVGGALESLTGNFAGLSSITGTNQSVAAVDERLQSIDNTLANLVASGSIEQATAGFDALAKKAQEQGTSIETLRDHLPQYQNELDGLRNKNAAAASSTDKTNASLDKQKAALAAVTAAADKNANALVMLTDGESAYWAAIDNASAALKKNGANFKANSEAGRENRDAMTGLVQKSKEYLKTMVDQGQPQKAINTQFEESRKRLYDMALGFTHSKTKAKEFADSLGKIPPREDTKVALDKAEAAAKLAEYQASLKKTPNQVGTVAKIDKAAATANATAYQGVLKSTPAWVSTLFRNDRTAATANTSAYKGVLNTVPDWVSTLFRVDKGAATASAGSYKAFLAGTPTGITTTFRLNAGNAVATLNNLQMRFRQIDGRTVSTYVNVQTTGNVASLRGIPTARASGGWIPGGPSAIDSVPAMLAPGEFVVNSFSAARNRGLLNAINSQHYASGGYVMAGAEASRAMGIVNLNVYGPIGSQSQLEDWLQNAINSLQRRGRL